ncbi:hypothetical protein SPSIL_036850 [Sporomusa silvacetica DSM 10669]|uniref:Polyketide cyclase / dehydrase and lipid transport n=1 Tax=Sporomusa silvacetica DSM 10669 TaxID=1123289 RepID=A0ABZ3IPK6_9FIRM|nr:hypothetical protein [Sporomusa silvacetica]OZC19868.1 hypothetical protein SPSIL_17910 [Sporomusa silvacetica DSM 10669]
MTEFSFQTEINASPEKIWEMYANVTNRFKWEFDLEQISLEGEFVTGSSGQIKLGGQPEMTFTLTSVIPHKEFWDRTVVPDAGIAVCFGHTLTKNGDKTLIKHIAKMEKMDGELSEEDIMLLSQIFQDTPQAILAIKKVVEAE